MENVLRPVEQQLAAYNARDLEAFLVCFAEDILVEDGVGNVQMQGREAFRERYGNLFANSPNLHCRLMNRIPVGNYVIDEERVTGSMGSGEERHVVAIYLVEDGLIQRVRFLR